MMIGENGGNCTLAPEEGKSSALPRSVHFLMNDKCNARCVMCGGDYYRSRSGRTITLDKFKTMAANLRLERFGSVALSGAGDPLLDPDLFRIIEFLNSSYPSVQVHITTNGIAMDPAFSERLLSFRIASVNVSMNSASRESYRRLMQVDQFEPVVRNLLAFVDNRRRTGARCALQLSSALNMLNIRELSRLVELAKGVGADSVNTMYCRFYPERLRKRVAVEGADALKESDSLFFHQQLSDELVTAAAKRAAELGIRFSHDPLFRDNAPARRCLWPETELMVGFDGEVYPCGGAEVHFREKVEGGIYDFGNVLRESIDTFWNGDLYRKLRVSSRGERRIVPECACCANLMKATDIRSHIMDWEEPQAGAKAAPEPSPRESARDGEPLVSVIVPTHNRPKMLAETLRSILAQTFRDFEIVVVNDAGPDVADVVESLNGEGNITYVRHSRNRGLAAARNSGIRVARGRYIAYLDDDDLYYPTHLETLVEALADGTRVAYTDAHRAIQERQGDGYVTVKRDLPYSCDFDRDRILICNFIPVLCFMHERSLIDETGFFDESLTSHEDWELWIRMSARAAFRHVPKVTSEFSWRVDGSTMTSSRRSDYLRTTLMIYEKHSAELAGRPELVELRRNSLAINYGYEAFGESGRLSVSIVIPVFNNLAYTRKCIESITGNSGAGVPHELIVVDNGSTDGTAEFLSSLSGDVKVIANGENLGFAKACNQGAAAAAGDYLVFLNNDTIVHPGWLEGVIRAFVLHRADICGVKLLYPDGTIQHAGVAFNEKGHPFHLFRGSPANAFYVNKVREFQCVTAACMGVKRELFGRLGGFDEGYRNGFEDVDLCLRAREAGCRIVYTPECVVTHFESKTPGRKRFDEENIDRMLSRWSGRLRSDDMEICRACGLLPVRLDDGRCVFVELGKENPVDDDILSVDLSAARLPGPDVPHDETLGKFHAMAGRALTRRRSYAEAVEHFSRALECGVKSALPDLADCLAKANRLEEAEAVYRSALTHPGSEARVRIGLGTLAILSGKAAEAADWFREAAGIEPSNALALCGLGMAADATGDAEGAFGWYGKALDADPSNRTALHEMVRKAFAQERFGEAEARIRKFLEFEPSNGHMLFSLAGICHKQGKRAEALDALDRLELFSPGYDGADQLRRQATA